MRAATRTCVAVALSWTVAAGAQDAHRAARLLIGNTGLYRVSFEDLRNAGLDLAQVPTQRINVYYRDDAIPIEASDGGDGVFGPGDHVTFFAEATTSVYAPHNVYWLRVGDAPAMRVSEVEAASFDGPKRTFIETVHLEPERFYLPTLPKALDADHWFAARVTDGRPAKFTVDLPGLDATSQEPGTVRVGLHGFSTLPPDPDHRTIVRLADRAIATDTWDGDVAHVIEATLQAGLLRPSGNEFVVEASKPEGVQFDVVLVDWIEVKYRRTFDASGGILIFPGDPTGGTYRVAHLPAKPEVVWRVDARTSVRAVPFRAAQAADGVAIQFAAPPAPEGARYIVATEEGLNKPVRIEPDRASSLRSENNRGDYLIVSHASLLDALSPLVEHRRKGGLAVLVADVQDVYDEFNGGIAEPVAIKRFVDFAYHHFVRPAPRFLLLVGDASYDYKRHKKESLPNLVPTYLVRTDPFGETGSDDWFACIEGDDVVPELAVGRIPARTAETVATVVRKTIEFETSPPEGEWAREALLVADNGIEPDRFEPEHQRICEEAAQVLKAHGWAVQTLYIAKGSENAAQVADRLQRCVDEGRKFVVYAGHAIFDRWAHEGILTTEKVAKFRNGGRLPFAVSLSCLDGMFYHAMRERSLAEQWVTTPGGGAVAYWSPTGMGYPKAHEMMLREFLKAAFSSEVETLGEAVRLAKANMLRESSDFMARDSAVMMTYFGDPALSVEAWRGRM